MSKPMSGAEYRAHAQRVKAKAPSEPVTLKSGSVFELRRPDLMGMVATGRLPQSLLTEAMAAWKKNGSIPQTQAASELAERMDGETMVNSLIFMREIVHECCVNPKFVEFATADDEIGAADMLPEDFSEIFSWAMGHQGVTGLDGLKSFREGRERGAAGNKSNRKKLRDQAEHVPAN